MTALTHRQFLAELDAIAADTDARGLPYATADAECIVCGTDGPVHITPEGLLCQDCRDAEPAPYDPSDEHDHFRDDWEND